MIRAYIGVFIMAASLSAEMTLFDFSRADELSRATWKDVETSLVKNENGPAMRMVTGVEYQWPSVYMKKPEGWDLSAFGELTCAVKNLAAVPVTVLFRIDSQPKGNTDPKQVVINTTKLYVEGERENTFRIGLRPMATSSKVKLKDFIGMRGTPLGGDTMYLENITQIIIYVEQDKKQHQFEVGNIVLTGTSSSAGTIPDEPFPMIDEFGQYKHKDWPGKTHSLDEMIQRRDEEAKDLLANPRPLSWNRYGGWKDGPTLTATGFFRTEKYNGKWYLVDPEGKLFFSQGIDCLHFGDSTSLLNREHWFEALPADDDASRDFYGKYKSHMMTYYYGGKDTRTFNFKAYNAMRKYGDDWKTKFAEVSVRRLPSWGINTIANWSRPEFYLQRKVPYTATVGTFAPVIEGSVGYWGKFADVFHPDFRANLKKRVSEERFTNTVNDPWCIGYFVDNELSWGDAVSLAVGALKSPAKQPAKIAFIDELKKKYGDIAALNEAWGMTHASWDAMLASTNVPAQDKTYTDLTNFYDTLSSMYFRTIRDVLKEVAPNQLYLGCRFAWGNAVSIQASARYCDVVSYNIYAKTPKAKMDMMKQAGDKPYIIGEFHFGALDRGMFHTGLVAVKDQKDRAATYTQYVTDCLNDPNIVGCHWFQYMDSPVTGRSLDGENYQIGFLDNVDTPYAEIIAAARKLGADMYRIRAGK